MYEAFDRFLYVPTWHTGHPADEERFLRALRRVVHQPDFDPEGLRAYILTAKNWELTDGALNDAADHYARLAGAVLKNIESGD